MLPDLRLLAIATISTFLVTVGAALFVSSRMLPEPVNFRADRSEEGPIGRISGSWPDARQLGPRDLNVKPKAEPKITDRPVLDSAPADQAETSSSGETAAPQNPSATTTDAKNATPGPGLTPPSDTGASSAPDTKPAETIAVKRDDPASGPAADDAAADQTGSIPAKPKPESAPVPSGETVAARPDKADEAPPKPDAAAVADKAKVEKPKAHSRFFKRRRHLVPQQNATNTNTLTNSGPVRDFFTDFPSGNMR
jgi:hypothetical protein